MMLFLVNGFISQIDQLCSLYGERLKTEEVLFSYVKSNVENSKKNKKRYMDSVGNNSIVLFDPCDLYAWGYYS